MHKLTREWARERMDGLWEEMVGIRPIIPDLLAGNPPSGASGNGLIDLDYARRWIPYSDVNAAQLIYAKTGSYLTYTGDDKGGRWYVWNGVYHEEVSSGIIGKDMIKAFAKQLVEALDMVDDEIESDIANRVANGTLAQNNVDQERKKLHARFKDHKLFQKKIHNQAGIVAVHGALRDVCTVEPDYFDDDRRWLVCQNGVIDLDAFRKGTPVPQCFLPHDPARPVTRAVECDFNPEAKAPVWEHFLETSQPDAELRGFMQRLVGAAFLGESKVKAIPNLVGPKDCGKSVFVTTLDDLAGGYGVQPAPDALLQKDGGAQNWEQEKLRGKRFVGVSEPPAGKRLDETFCKQVTGGDIVHTRAHYQSSTGWTAQCVIFVASNHNVKFNTQDEAFLERLCFIKFPHRFWEPSEAEPGEQRLKDPDLEEKLKREYEGIFLWVIRGMWEYLWHGLRKPDSVKRAGLDVAVEASSALTWIREKEDEGLLEIVPSIADRPNNHYVLINKLFDLYQMESGMNGEKPLGKHAFSRHVQSYYGDKLKSGGWRFPRIVGIGDWAMLNVAVDSRPNHDF